MPQLEEYLQLFKPLIFFIAYQLKEQTCLGYPTNQSDAQQRFGLAKTIPVHLVTKGAMFEQIIARFDVAYWWFEYIDSRAVLLIAEELQSTFKNITPPKEVKFKGMTSEMRIVYDLVARKKE